MRETRVTRRALFQAAAALAALTACTPDPGPPPPPDPLVELAAQARADAASAQAIATAVAALAAPAGEVAKIRAEHATVLQAEADRERPPKSGAPTTAPPSTSPAPTPAEPAAAKTFLIEALTAAEQKAAAVIATVPRYRAGMVGSVVAACASLREVLA
ncbi:hypothetical protein [Alloactinosynnema sp. L-07]|uniref:hypothetical protein n=1 Tax=Alloactinosynnema sp. L-07 TaxID=1653480 RepID=UPI001E3EBB47|nr:hypothetical protein [Alloactinosynnema sp. L-07]